MSATEVIGIIAGACTTIAFIPQVIHTLRTRDTSAISLGMYILFVAGILMWLCYGILLDDLPLIVANLITLLLASIILILKIQQVYRSRY